MIVYEPAVVGDCQRTAIAVADTTLKNFPIVVGSVVFDTSGDGETEIKDPPVAVIAAAVDIRVYKESTPPALTVAVCPVESLTMLFAVSPEERAACPVVATSVAG